MAGLNMFLCTLTPALPFSGGAGYTGGCLNLKDVDMKSFPLVLLPGDGIGPEVMAQVRRLIAHLEKSGEICFEIWEDVIGGAAIDALGRRWRRTRWRHVGLQERP